jgi:hypothetical protein
LSYVIAPGAAFRPPRLLPAPPFGRYTNICCLSGSNYRRMNDHSVPLLRLCAVCCNCAQIQNHYDRWSTPKGSGLPCSAIEQLGSSHSNSYHQATHRIIPLLVEVRVGCGLWYDLFTVPSSCDWLRPTIVQLTTRHNCQTANLKLVSVHQQSGIGNHLQSIERDCN